METKNQLRAINSNSKYILCVAGAGAGKTRVLTERLSRLIKEDKAKDFNILCLTFSRNAGREMKERILNLIGEKGQNVFCNTFHTFCINLLREWGWKLGYSKDFSICTEDEKIDIIKDIFIELCIAYKKEDISEKDIKNTLLCLEHPEYSKKDNPKLSKYILIANEYKFKLRKNSAIDLDMILSETLRLIKTYKEVQEYCHNTFTYCFIDEYQDNNYIQENIIKTMNPENLFVVGDVDQCIYRWRKADPQIMLNFSKEYPDCEVIVLEDNFRSTYPIVAAANNLIKNNKERFEKKLIAHKDGEKIECLEAENPFQEAMKIRDIIKNSGKDLKDFSILARNNSMLKNIFDIFKVEGIPCQLCNNQNVFNQKDIKRLLNFIDSCNNYKNDILMKKSINFSNKILNPEQICKVELKCIEKEISFFEGLKTFKFKDQSKVNKFLHDILKINEFMNSNNNAFEVLKYVINYLNIKMEGLEFIYHKLFKWCEEQEEIHENSSIDFFLKWIKTKDTSIEMSKEKNAVKLMTIHSAKGLEFPIVFVIGLSEGIFPNKRSPLEDERNLAYVGITRAINKLYLTRPVVITYPNNFKKKLEPSIFLKEIQS